jgi:hypothetical protein
MHFLHPVTQQDNRIGGVMVSVLAWSEVDGGFEPWSGQTKVMFYHGYYNIGSHTIILPRAIVAVTVW